MNSKLYDKYIIAQLEEKIKDLKTKMLSKKFFDRLHKNLYREYIEKYNDILIDKYQVFDGMSEKKVADKKE